MKNVRKSTASQKINKDQDVDKTSIKQVAAAAQPAGLDSVKKIQNSGSQFKKSSKSKVLAKAKSKQMQEVVEQDKIFADNINLISKDERQGPVNSLDVRDVKEGIQNINIESKQKYLINQLEIPSLQGSVQEEDGGYQKAASGNKVSNHQDLADVDQPDVYTYFDQEGLERDEKDHDGFNYIQEFVNEAPDLGLLEDDRGMIGFDEFQDEFNASVKENNPKLGDEIFDDINDLLSQNGDSASVKALTLKDGINYEDDKFDEIAAAHIKYEYQNKLPAGFSSDDDINGDGQIDHIERAIKVDYKITKDYLKTFRKEVDFHHKVAYRFEKAYRLGKKQTVKKAALNAEIISIISEHDSYIEQDPMALFYCLYFCIYYNNPELLEFLQILIEKTDEVPKKIDEILRSIVMNGIGRLRQVGNPLNQHIYHMVFYQAVDDELRIVYSQILKQLKQIQLRDKDAQYLLTTRDWDLIRLSFDKYTSKINSPAFFKLDELFKCHNYRHYNQAYYEEIVIDCTNDQRVASNYRERFLTKKEEVFLVLKMYCKNDYVGQFLRTDIQHIDHNHFIELFVTCIKNDSFKIGMQIYLRYLSSNDISQKILQVFIFSIRDSCLFHEIKLFFIHEHFNVLSVIQLNQLVDFYMEILHRKIYKTNPMLSQYNTIKYALLIYRISWKIAQKRIYSLITKCSLLNAYLLKCLNGYLLRQQHISKLYEYMSEPIFHMTERKDSLDIMLEMNMDVLLKHPVIVEVLNLVYEGKYSVDPSALNLSQSFQCFFLMETSDLKSINSRLIQNIISFEDNNAGKQASLQFNIWKQCIEQREKDEMLFSIIFSIIIIFFTIVVDELMAEFNVQMDTTYGKSFIYEQALFIDSTQDQLQQFCPETSDMLLLFATVVKYFMFFVMFSGLGYLTVIIQKFTIFKLKDNVELSVSVICLEFSIVVATALCIEMYVENSQNHLFTDTCSSVMDFSPQDKELIGYLFALLANTSRFPFSLIISVIVCQYSLIMIVMLQRTQKLGEIIMMNSQMIKELQKFFLTFGLPLGLFVILGRYLTIQLKIEPASYFQIILDTFDGFMGEEDLAQYQNPQGKIFITFLVLIFNVLLISFLVAMFINRYKSMWNNLEALKRMNIIRLKNTNSYDKLYGGVTITFFPISIIMLPFIIPVVVFKSERLNEFILKIQYTVMILMYCIIGFFISFPIIPMLYMKQITNAIYIYIYNKRQDYKGQHVINAMFTILFGPIILVLSLFADLLRLPKLLLVDEQNFEFKYQASQDSLNQQQTDVLISTFSRFFYVNFKEKFAGKSVSLIDLMLMHREIFSLIENLHDLCCKGTKDYREALANVQDYNLTKILTRKCSVPNKSGNTQLNRCEFDILYACQMDIEIYNYTDDIFHQYRQGQLLQYKQGNRKEQEPGTIKGFSSGVVFLPLNSSPSYMTYKRDNADFMNNFFVNIIARSFTDIEEFLKAQEESFEANVALQTLQELNIIREHWKNSLVQEATEKFASYDTYILGANQLLGQAYNKKINMRVGDENSYGVTVKGINGKETNDIHELMDI